MFNLLLERIDQIERRVSELEQRDQQYGPVMLQWTPTPHTWCQICMQDHGGLQCPRYRVTCEG